MRSHLEDIIEAMKRPDSSMRNCPNIDQALSKKSKLKVGDLEFKVIEARGHSPGHYAFYCPSAKVLISGDLFFRKSYGPTDIEGSDPIILRNSLLKLKALIPDDVLCIPGHGRTLQMRDWRVPSLDDLQRISL